jgi:LPS-assembly protein
MTRAPFHFLWRVALTLLAIWLSLAGPAQAQQDAPVTALVADLVRIDGNDRLIATGNVEVFSRDTRLRASSILYDRTTDRVTIEGPIELRNAEGTIVLADQAELDTDLTDGILRGARIVLNEQLQIAGAEMARRQGRFNDLRQVTASSCKVCETGETPLWEIRASRVIHDQEAGQIYFYNARFRIAGIPVFYLPAIRVPDGSNPRVRGFLAPSFLSTTQLGNGIRVPYFIPLGDHADVLLAPYVSENQSRTIEGRYRQAFVNGDLIANGAASRDTLEPGKNRGYLFIDGVFSMPRDFTLSFNLETTSDDAYMRDYEFSEKDRLDSNISISRYRQNELIESDLIFYQSLRADFNDQNEPNWEGDAQWIRRLEAPGIGGWVDVNMLGHFHHRESSQDIVGRDMAQVRGNAAWRNVWTGPAGMRIAGQAELTAELKQISDDSEYEQYQAGLWPQGALTLSWPLIRPGTDGSYQLLEPVAQLAYTADTGIDSPNDDSTQVTLDTGNLFAFNRFPGLDEVETGTRANVGLRWGLIDPDGTSLRLTGGRIFRKTDLDQFTVESGLAGARSDWLAQIDLDVANRIMFRTLGLFGDNLEPSIFEARLLFFGPWGSSLTSSYAWQEADSSADLSEDISEISASAEVPLSRSWSANGLIRRDLIAERTNYSSFGLGYENECIRVDLSVVRRFRATSDVEATTTYGLSVELAGFGSERRSPTPGRCTN